MLCPDLREDTFAKKANDKPRTQQTTTRVWGAYTRGVVNIGRAQVSVSGDSCTAAEPMEINMVELRRRPPWRQ